jgi:hypothetical protein
MEGMMNFMEFDTYEVHPCVVADAYELSGGTYRQALEQTNDDDPNIAVWAVYGHINGKGLVWICDCEEQQVALLFKKLLEEKKEMEKVIGRIFKDSALWDMWFRSCKTTGSYTEAVEYIIENLYFEEAAELNAFGIWLEKNNLNCGSGNYWTRYQQFRKETKDE